MKFRYRSLFTLLPLCLAVACGQSEAEKQAEQIREGVEQMAKGAEDVARTVGENAAQQAQEGGKQMAQGLEQLAKGLGQLATGKEPVEPVSFRALYDYFPDVTGWEKSRPTGERLTAPVRFSQAKVTYTRGEARIEASITDSGFNGLLVAPYVMMLKAGYERETEDGYERSTKVGGQPGWEKWEKGGRGEVNAFVGERYLVQLEGRNLEDAKPLHALADAARLDALADLK